ncbi:MAG: TolC family protein [Bacteroidetes bacterium HGW-Bacteroidetes-12]|nr:MAG: TolC family protein [Bacteroidetes bacterium HGW-Bacteroidetes-12]
MKKYYFILLLLIVGELSAQNNENAKTWTLQECVDYALKNNISIKQSELEKQNQYQNVINAKGNFLPNLNGSAAQNYNFGSSIDVTGSRVSADFRSNNFGLNSSIVLFDGFANIYTLNQAKLNYEVQNANVQKMMNDITLNIVNNYLQVLFAKEQIKIAQFQVDISLSEVERIENLVDVGVRPKGDLLNIKSTLANDEQSLIQAQNTFELATLRLAQLLQLKEGTIAIEDVEIKNTNTLILANSSTQIYEKAVVSFPEIKAAELTIQSADKQISISRARYLPSLSFNYGLNSTYQHRQGAVDFFSFSQQLDNNLGHFLGISLNVPIFNRFQFRTNVNRAEINFEQAQYNLESEQLRLRESVQNSYTDATLAAKTYEAAQTSVKAQTEAFNYEQERFKEGTTTPFDFNQIKSRLFQAQSQEIRAKYDFVFKTKVLEFYYGIPIVIDDF